VLQLVGAPLEIAVQADHALRDHGPREYSANCDTANFNAPTLARL
jgi:hypothetical protein